MPVTAEEALNNPTVNRLTSNSNNSNQHPLNNITSIEVDPHIILHHQLHQYHQLRGQQTTSHHLNQPPGVSPLVRAGNGDGGSNGGGGGGAGGVNGGEEMMPDDDEFNRNNSNNVASVAIGGGDGGGKRPPAANALDIREIKINKVIKMEPSNGAGATAPSAHKLEAVQAAEDVEEEDDQAEEDARWQVGRCYSLACVCVRVTT